MSTTPSTIRRDFNSPEVDERDAYQPRHRDESAKGRADATTRDNLARRIPNHPLAAYVGQRRGAVTA